MGDQRDVDMILGGFQSLGRGLEPFAKREEETRQRERPLSPYEKWLGKVLSGELSPDQAAAHAKLEMQGIQTEPPAPRQAPGLTPDASQPQQQGVIPGFLAASGPPASSGLSAPPDQPWASASPGPGRATPPAARPQPGYNAPQGLGTPPPPGQPYQQSGGLGGPETAGDFSALMGAAPFLRAAKTGANALTFEQRQILALQAQAAAQQRTDTTTGSRESEGAKGREAKKAHDETYGTLQRELTTQKMNTAIEIARMRMQNSKHSAYAKTAFKPVEILQKQVAATDAAIGKLAMSIGALTPGSPEATHVQKMIQEANSERSLLMAKLESALNVVTSLQDESGSESESSPAYPQPQSNPGIAAQPGLTPVQMPGMSANIGVPKPAIKVKGPVNEPSASDLNRLFGK